MVDLPVALALLMAAACCQIALQLNNNSSVTSLKSLCASDLLP